MKRCADTPANGFFTTWSLKYPFDQCVDTIGGERVAVWANTQGLPLEVMDQLRQTMDQSNSHDIRPLLESTVREAERKATPLACLILGKA